MVIGNRAVTAPGAMRRTNTDKSDSKYAANTRMFFDAPPANEQEKKAELKAAVDKFFGSEEGKGHPVRAVHTATGAKRVSINSKPVD